MVANGRLDVSTLTPIGSGLFLEDRAAQAWFAAREAVTGELGRIPIVTTPDGAYRDIAGQIRQKAYWTAKGEAWKAAVPGMSTHGLGVTVDIYNISRFNLPDLERVMARFGFRRTIPSESWHFQHDGSTVAAVSRTEITASAVVVDIQEKGADVPIVIRSSAGNISAVGNGFVHHFDRVSAAVAAAKAWNRGAIVECTPEEYAEVLRAATENHAGQPPVTLSAAERAHLDAEFGKVNANIDDQPTTFKAVK